MKALVMSGKVSNTIFKLMLVVIAISLLSLSAIFINGIFQHGSITHDASIFAEMARVVIAPDKTLYVDFWDHKPPGIAFYTAPFILIFGTSTLAVQMAALVMVALFAAGVGLLAHKLFKQPIIVLGAGILALYYGLLIIYPRLLETVVLMATLATWSIYAAVIARGRIAYLIGSGILFGLAVLAKQPIATNVITLLAVAWYFSPHDKKVFSVLMVIVGGIASAFVVIGWALRSGNFEAMWLYSTVANVRFSLTSDNSWLSGVDGFYLKRDTLPTLIPLATMSIVASILLFRTQHRKPVLLLLFWIICGIPGAILGRGLTLNYFYQIVPPLIILSCAMFLAARLWHVTIKVTLLILFAFAIVLLPQTYLSNVTSYFIATPSQTAALNQAVAYIDATTDVGDCIFIWGQANSVSYYSGRYACAAAPHAGVLMLEDAFDVQQNRINFMQELLDHPPKYHILNTNWAYFPTLEQYVHRYIREQIPDLSYQVFRMDTSSWHDANVNFGDLFTMIGYDIYRKRDEVCLEDRVSYSMTWRVEQAPTQYYQMFLQLRDAETHTTIASVDSAPLADYPTQAWVQIGEIVLSDTFILTIPEDTPPGTYYVATGFYDTNTSERLNILDESDTILGSETTIDTFSVTSCVE